VVELDLEATAIALPLSSAVAGASLASKPAFAAAAFHLLQPLPERRGVGSTSRADVLDEIIGDLEGKDTTVAVLARVRVAAC